MPSPGPDPVDLTMHGRGHPVAVSGQMNESAEWDEKGLTGVNDSQPIDRQQWEICGPCLDHCGLNHRHSLRALEVPGR